MAAADKSPGRRLRANPEKRKAASKAVLEHILAPNQAVYFFGRKTCLFGEDESTTLMDNAGEGTPGAGLWEGKFEQKKPF